MIRALIVLAFAWLVLATPAAAQNGTNVNPPVNMPLSGCVEGRALRIVNGAPSCSTTAPPTVTACTGGSIDSTATDFVGQVSIPTGLTSCTVVMTKLYPTNFVCLLGNQSGLTLTLTSPSVGNNGLSGAAARSTLVVPFGLTLAPAKFGYFCAPG